MSTKKQKQNEKRNEGKLHKWSDVKERNGVNTKGKRNRERWGNT